MLSLLLVLLAFIASVFADRSEGCKDYADPSEAKNFKDTAYDFQERAILISYPPKYKSTKPSSVIIAFHDRAQTPIIMQEETLLSNQKINPNAIVVYVSPRESTWMTDPEGKFKPSEFSFDSAGDDPENDIFFTGSLIDHLKEKYCINTRRIYAVGHGTGGGMMRQLACQPAISRKIAAYAAVGAGMLKNEEDPEDRFWGTCMIGRRPIPILTIHAEDDEVWPASRFKLQKTSAPANALSAREWTDQWRILNLCGDPVGETKPSIISNAVVLTELENGQKSESICYGGSVLRTTYRCGYHKNARENDDFLTEEKDQGRLDIVHYEALGAKHGWPRVTGSGGERQFHGKTVMPEPGRPASFDATAAIIKFFQHHRLPDDRTVHAQAKELLIERGARVYREGIPGREPSMHEFYGRPRDEL